jgi:hypothetical protein
MNLKYAVVVSAFKYQICYNYYVTAVSFTTTTTTAVAIQFKVIYCNQVIIIIESVVPLGT